MPALHWSQRYGCICGMKFRSYAADAFHRHNFPALCRSAKPKRTKAASNSAQPTPAPTFRIAFAEEGK